MGDQPGAWLLHVVTEQQVRVQPVQANGLRLVQRLRDRQPCFREAGLFCGKRVTG